MQNNYIIRNSEEKQSSIPKYENKNLLTIPEGKTFDRKSAKYDLNKIANILIAFANADGGTVALGISEKKYEGVKKFRPACTLAD